MSEPTQNAVNDNENILSLFTFIKELNELKQETVLDVKAYPWATFLDQLPDDPEHITIAYADRVDDETGAESESNVLLSVHKPAFEPCPQPDKCLLDWLQPGWDDYTAEEQRIERKPAPAEEDVPGKIEDQDAEKELSARAEDPIAEEEPVIEERYIRFEDDPERTAAYGLWLPLRDAWAERQRLTVRTRSLFSQLYGLYFDMLRDQENYELVAANGMLYDKENAHIRHPVLTRRMKLEYDANLDTVYILDSGAQSELYSGIFLSVEGINKEVSGELEKELQENDFHPLDRNDTPIYFERYIHRLSAHSVFSREGIPENWRENGRFLLTWEPCYIWRKRVDGTLKAVEQIKENIVETGYVPEPIKNIVCGGTLPPLPEQGEETVEQQLAAVGGESVDVLLSKQANKEQLEIAKRIEQYHAVLVQGPPGTGKTHTIANLLGHFLAQGKSVLVTSQTPKALKVLKDKVAPGLQNLCVSVLEDSNEDMERAVDGITDYIGETTVYAVEEQKNELAQRREHVIADLATVRKTMFQLIHQECNSIVFNGESYSPSQAAAFVLEHMEDYAYIPGKVRLNTPLPLSYEELSELYRTNERISVEDEEELTADLPNPDELQPPDSFRAVWDSGKTARQQFAELAEKAPWAMENQPGQRALLLKQGAEQYQIPYPEQERLEQLSQFIAKAGKISPWMKFAVADGKNGGAFRQRWLTLMEQIEKTSSYAEGLVTIRFEHDIVCSDSADLLLLEPAIGDLKTQFAQKGKLSKLGLVMHKDWAAALDSVTIDGKKLASAHDCDMVLQMIELQKLRNQCANYWDKLMAQQEMPAFFELNEQEPERIAQGFVEKIRYYLDWYETAYEPLLQLLEHLQIPEELLVQPDPLDTDLQTIDKTLDAIAHKLPLLCDAFHMVLRMEQASAVLMANRRILSLGKRMSSGLCMNLVQANDTGDTEAYEENYLLLQRVYAKYSLQKHREELLGSLMPVAPQWAEAIRQREGIHGLGAVPDTIEEAWKWKQFSGMIDEITAQPFSDLQEKAVRLSRQYRKITADYAEKCAWYHLMQRLSGNITMLQALQGWKSIIKKIGKGTGKRAPKLKAEARKLMVRCQAAVPAWIMPISRALDSLDPRENRFDIIIIDEASQSDISSLALLYMGRKLIIVGDDKQVSPSAIGVKDDEVEALQAKYLKGRVPNAHLYDAKTSIYDIAKTTFQPLMLKEHFRCVPEIIGFSNMLSYDYQIKPLREASSSKLLPAVVNYRVQDGQRDGKYKRNQKEAEAIVTLMQACMDQPEYAGKTFGVISLLGDDQVKLIQQLVEQRINTKEIVNRKILCGNASHFQGDERDVIFLSLVDSGNETGPVRMQGFGTEDTMRKRYNVAASRARDQLWVVHSLDAANDLKSGDLRKRLIDYAANPQAFAGKVQEIAEKAESPFEQAVAEALVSRGYHLEQQWPVGAYRLDMVAVCGQNMVAIECDGERYHSSEAQIRSDMERQTILERLGWRFIRIRGSEYYRDPEKTIERVIAELQNYEIEPEEAEIISADRNTELLRRVKARAAAIMLGEDAVLPLLAEEEPTLQVTAQEPEQSVSLPCAPETEESVPETESAPVNEEVETEVEGDEDEDEPDAPDEALPKEADEPVILEEVLSKADEPEPYQLGFWEPAVTAPVAQIPAQEPEEPQQTVLSDLASPTQKAEDVIPFLMQSGVICVDKRAKGGAFWVIGGSELTDICEQCKAYGVTFTYKKGGGRVTKGQDGWWAKF